MTRDRYGEPTDDDETPADWCDCRDATVHAAWMHDGQCPRYAPPLTGPGSTPEGRAKAREMFDALRRKETDQ